MPGRAARLLTSRHRRRLLRRAATVRSRVERLALAADVTDIDGWFATALHRILPLVRSGHGASRRLAVTYLREHARAEGRAVAPVPARFIARRAVTSLRVTGPVEFKRQIAAGVAPMEARRTMADTMSAAAQRQALAGERDTVAATVRDSDEIVGWRRVPDADPCAWCVMLASRGAVYTSERTAGGVVGQYHDGCECTVEPLYTHEDEPAEVKELYQQWLRVTAGHSGNAAVRVWRRYWDEREKAAGAGVEDRGRAAPPEPRQRRSEPAAPPEPKPEPAPAAVPSPNPSTLTGDHGTSWWEILKADTGPDAPIPVTNLRLRSGYVVGRGLAYRTDGITYLIEDEAGTPEKVLREFREVHRSLPAGAGEHQQAYLWLADRNPEDVHWEKKYDTPGFKSFAVAGDRSVTVWGRRGQFFGPGSYGAEMRHEFGHNVSSAAVSRGLHHRGSAWADAVQDDRGADSRIFEFKGFGKQVSLSDQPGALFPSGVTAYGKSSVSEDYAEAMSLYLSGAIGHARLSPAGGSVRVYFREIFPARAAIFDQLFPAVARRQIAEIAALRGR
jgi:hypothetical protein